MEIWRILQKIQDDKQLRNFENNFKEFEDAVNVPDRTGPFIGRILTQEKFYAGKIEKLKLNDGQLEFTIIDCDGNGKTDNNSKIYQKKISWEKLKDIQVLKDQKGKLLWLKDLLNDKNSEVKND